MSEPGAPPRRPAGRWLALPALDLAQNASDVGARSSRGIQPNVDGDQLAIASSKPIEQHGQLPQRPRRVREASHEQHRRLAGADALQSLRDAVAHDPGHVHADPRGVGGGIGFYVRRVVGDGAATVHAFIVRKYIA